MALAESVTQKFASLSEELEGKLGDSFINKLITKEFSASPTLELLNIDMSVGSFRFESFSLLLYSFTITDLDFSFFLGVGSSGRLPVSCSCIFAGRSLALTLVIGSRTSAKTWMLCIPAILRIM